MADAAKTILITGSTDGLGRRVAERLAESGNMILIHGRDRKRGERLVRNILGAGGNAAFYPADFSELADVRRLADHIQRDRSRLDVLVPRWEAQFATDHLGHFALTNLILDQIGRGHGIRAFSLHPGTIFTPLQRHLTRDEMIAEGWLEAEGNPADPTFKAPAQGAATQVWAAASPMPDGLGGLYCKHCDIAVRAEVAAEPFVGVKAWASDTGSAERSWRLSAELTRHGFGRAVR